MSVVEFSRHDNVGLIRVDNPPINALSQAVRAGIKEAVARGIADPRVAAMVILCAGRTFIAGADIREFGKPPLEPPLPDVIDAIENSSKPVVAAIHGTALGGGFELALGCHFRLAAADARVGLPEVKLGLLPGAGGTQRLPRLVGVELALRMIVEGNPLPAPEAQAAGALDELVDGGLEPAALAFAAQVIEKRWPLRRVRELDLTFDNPDFFDEFEQSISRKQRGFLAPFHCISAVRAATEMSFDEGSAYARELFQELLASPQSRAQRHAFFAERAAARIPDLPPDTPTRDIASVGVIGAGTMGSGIAMCFANAGIRATLLETSQANVDRGLTTIHENYARSVSRGSLTQAEMDARKALIGATLRYDDLREIDLVIEAAFEDIDVKREVFTRLDAVCKPGAILASNTSYLDIDEIAAFTKRPQDVLGMHFFSPANVMRLLENVRGAHTAPDVLATAQQIGKRIGKVPVLVGACQGFVGNRMLAKRTREAYFLLEEGALPRQVDEVFYDFGFPMGPFAIADLAGLDIGWRNRKANFDKLSPREQACNILDQICELERFGQKTGAGFYRYDDQRRAIPDPEIDALIVRHSAARGITRREISAQEILERCLYAMINEGAKILAEGIAARASDIDLVWLHGYGFPAYRGGPMFYADEVGLETIYEALSGYSEKHGEEYWRPATLLETLARDGRRFSEGD